MSCPLLLILLIILVRLLCELPWMAKLLREVRHQQDSGWIDTTTKADLVKFGVEDLTDTLIIPYLLEQPNKQRSP